MFNRVQFFKGTTEVKGFGYQPFDDYTLPACWLEGIVNMYFEELLQSLRDPGKVYTALTRRSTGRFVLDPVNPTYNDTYLVPGKCVHFVDESKARTLEEIFVAKLRKRNVRQVEYLSEESANSVGMQFHVDGERVMGRYHAHIVAVSSALLAGNPDLVDVLLALIGEIANSFTEGGQGNVAERGLLQGLSDTHRVPFTWRSDARRLLHRVPDEVFCALEPEESDTDGEDSGHAGKSVKATRITQFEGILREATTERA